MQIIYTESARKRIAKLGITAINGFIDELPASQRGRVLADLPKMQGFRKNSPFELKERAKTFAIAISHAADHKYREHDIEWKAFTVAWLCWAKNLFSIELDKFSGESQRDLAEYVLRTAGDFNCAREDIERLALFSYLPDDMDSASFIAARPSKDELRSRRQVAELPSRVDTLAHRLDDTIGRIAEMEKGQRSALAEIAQNETISALDKRLFYIEKRLEIIEEPNASLQKKIDTISEYFRSEIDSNKEQLHESQNRTEEVSNIIAALKKEFPELRQSLNDSLRLLDELSQRVAEIPRQATDQDPSVSAPSRSTENFGAVILVQPEPSSQIKTLDGVGAIVQSLTDNFCAVGLERDDAESLARIVTTGLLAGQLVNYSGSLADLLADTTCASVFGSGHVECEIPMGLCDGAYASTCERRLAESAANSALVLRGANRSAFEVYGANIRNHIIGRQIGRPDRLDYRALIATACGGPSILDANESTLALGPSIDSDHLRWTIPKWKKIRLGALKDVPISGLYKQHDDMPDLLATINPILKGSPRISALRRAVLIRAASALQLIPSLDDSIRLELLIASWIVPYQRCLGITEDSIRKQAHQVLKSSDLKVNLLSAVLEDNET